MKAKARLTVSLSKIIENLREITWEHGNVRYGTRIKDNKNIPMWHSSDAAAIGYIIEEELKKEGFLDTEGKMIKEYILHDKEDFNINSTQTILADIVTSEKSIKVPMLGERCKNCGDNAVVKRDGCEICDSCGEIGSCG